MKTLVLVLTAVVSIAGATISAQTTTVFENCVAVGRKRLARGDVVRVACDSAYLYNRPTELLVRGRQAFSDSLRTVNAALRRVTDSLQSRLMSLAALRDSINIAQRKVIDTLWAIHRVDSTAFASMRGFFRTTDSLARASTANTDRALTYARRIRFVSFIASGFGGGVVGGLGIKSGSGAFNWQGAGIGAGVGVLTNILLMKLVH